MPDPRVAAIRAELIARRPIDDREARSIEEFVRALDELPAPFDEESGPDHITASAFVVSDRGIVLHRHRRNRLWLQPGGHIDPGELPGEAAWREAIEETGLPVERPSGPAPLAHVDVHPGAKATCRTHYDLRYVFVCPPVDPSPPPHESQDVRWHSWAEAQARGTLSGALDALRAANWWLGP